MIKNIAICLVILVIPATFIFCGTGSNDVEKTKGKIMSLEINNVAYPVRFANFQRNSNVPVEMKSKWKPLWSKEYIEVDEELIFGPYIVQVNDNYIGVRSESEMLVYDSAGNYKYRLPVSGSADVTFGLTAVAFLSLSHQLVYQDYEYNPIGQADVIPELDEWSQELLLVPSLDNVLAVIQYSGGPMREPKKYFVYSFQRQNGMVNWFQEFEGIVNHAFLSNDGKRIIIIRQTEVVQFDAKSGKILKSFKINIENAVTASIDFSDNLILLDIKDENGTIEKTLKAFSPDGAELWSLPVQKPQEVQPAACGRDGRVYIMDGLSLNCIVNGAVSWTALLKPAEKNWLTITKDNYAVVINGNFLVLFNPDGEKVYERLITKTDETFPTPPAVDSDGHIFIAGEVALYCFE